MLLAQKDFQKTSTIPKDELLLNILKEAQKIVNFPQTSILLWQKNESNKDGDIMGIIKSDNKNILTQLNNSFEIIPGDWIKVGPFENFSEAETELRSIFREIRK